MHIFLGVFLGFFVKQIFIFSGVKWDFTPPGPERDRAMALCMLHMGLRASEVAKLSLEDIDWHRSTLKLCQGKPVLVGFFLYTIF